MEKIIERAVYMGVEGVHGEIAPLGVLLPILAEGDVGMASEMLCIDT